MYRRRPLPDQGRIRYRDRHLPQPPRHRVEGRADVGLDPSARLAIVAAKDGAARTQPPASTTRAQTSPPAAIRASVRQGSGGIAASAGERRTQPL